MEKLRKSAFTLIEVLVVMVLIATLAAMLLPVFAAARERVRQNSCGSNLRQLGVAITMYAQDYDGYYPYGADPLDKNTYIWEVDPKQNKVLREMPLLNDVLHPYVKNVKVWKCPSDTGFDVLEDHPDPTIGEPIRLPTHPSAFAVFGSSYVYRTELAFRQKLLSTSGREGPDRREVGAANITVLTDLAGRWHGGEKMQDMQYMALMGDGHVEKHDIGGNARWGSVDLDKN